MCSFLDNSPESEQQAINTDFTFELFICAAILLERRETLLQCSDEVQLIQFTSRFVVRLRFFIYSFCRIFPPQEVLFFLFYKVTNDTFVSLILAAVFRERWIWTARWRKQSTFCTTTASATLGTVLMATGEHKRPKKRTFSISSGISLF